MGFTALVPVFNSVTDTQFPFSELYVSVPESFLIHFSRSKSAPVRAVLSLFTLFTTSLYVKTVLTFSGVVPVGGVSGCVPPAPSSNHVGSFAKVTLYLFLFPALPIVAFALSFAVYSILITEPAARDANAEPEVAAACDAFKSSIVAVYFFPPGYSVAVVAISVPVNEMASPVVSAAP